MAVIRKYNGTLVQAHLKNMTEGSTTEQDAKDSDRREEAQAQQQLLPIKHY